MPLRLIVSSCDNGPCPAFHKTDGGVVIQALKTSAPEHLPANMPDHEGVLFIPDDAWELLISRLLSLRKVEAGDSALRSDQPS